jgi:hypothetical protein
MISLLRITSHLTFKCFLPLKYNSKSILWNVLELFLLFTIHTPRVWFSPFLYLKLRICSLNFVFSIFTLTSNKVRSSLKNSLSFLKYVQNGIGIQWMSCWDWVCLTVNSTDCHHMAFSILIITLYCQFIFLYNSILMKMKLKEHWKDIYACFQGRKHCCLAILW